MLKFVSTLTNIDISRCSMERNKLPKLKECVFYCSQTDTIREEKGGKQIDFDFNPVRFMARLLLWTD